MRRFLLGLAVPIVLLTAACGSSSQPTAQVQAGSLSDVTVTGPTTAKPTIDFKAPLHFATTTSKAVVKGPGTGPAVSKTSSVTVDYVGINASDGTEFDSSWKRGSPATFSLSSVISGFSTGLLGAHAGDRVLIDVASKDGYDPTGNGSTIRKGDSLIFVVDVRKVANPLTIASGKAVKAPSTVPTLTYNAKHQPVKFTATPQTLKNPTRLGVYPIVQGTGAKVQSGQTITVEYVGQLYPDGKVFDESWSHAPASFPIGVGRVIAGWDQGLVGQRVGSRVILVIPSALAYGPQGRKPLIPPDANLIFAIDILQAQ